jgi:hypothetical protein
LEFIAFRIFTLVLRVFTLIFWILALFLRILLPLRIKLVLYML